MTTFLLFLLLGPSSELVSVQSPQLAPPITIPLAARVYQATALLYSQDGQGAMHMLCTATAYSKLPEGYLFVTASHCVSNQADYDKKDKIVAIEQDAFFITFDETDKKEFIRADVIAAGLQSKGDDFAILRVKTAASVPTVPLGDELKELMGAPIINVASPQGLGRQLMKGYISMPRLERPVKENDINWEHAIVLQMPVGPGSSGSSIVSIEQESIVGAYTQRVHLRGFHGVHGTPAAADVHRCCPHRRTHGV